MPSLNSLQRVRKPTTRKGKKILLAKEPKVVENFKRKIFLTGRRASDALKNCSKDLYKISKPNAVILSKKNDILPFEDITPIERFCRNHESSVFFFTSSNKKRPNSLIIGRLFDGNLLDMVEFSVNDYKSLDEYSASIPTNTKPCLVFSGELWEQSQELQKVKSLLVDVFRGEVIDAIRPQGLEHVLMFTATTESILMRSYKILLKKSSTKLPRVELEDLGPHVDLALKRVKFASDDLMKRACRTPQEAKSKPKKNISKDALGTTHGRVHMGKQDVTTIQTRKMKGLKKSAAEKKVARKKKAAA
ncbi:ribosome production factor 2 homolog [Neocloeon triangulifer]|uniref:ribosome production factor 2 homolog n=1 Tax=Neocloeon triangulifer TaxID=2078957 RepID=UPI00286EE075|nr:ribosome production factor 2 homolog [Neocloeon triangulifer]